MGTSRSGRGVFTALPNRLLIPAAVALAAGIGGIAFGLANDDTVTAVGALLFLPSAGVLFGIAAKRRGVGRFESSRRGAD